MNRKTLTVFACLGWGLFAVSLFSSAPADERGGGSDPLTPNCPADLAPGSGDGSVGTADLLYLINNWGPCPAGCANHAQCADTNPCTQDLCVGGQCQNNPIAGCCQSAQDCPTVPNAASICQGNQCVLVCNVGYVDCDSVYGNGCEVYVLGDPQNCFACGLVCPSPANATAICVNGVCDIVCNVGYANCDFDNGNGCEVSLQTDPQNCGACATSCPQYPNTVPTCVNGVCVVVCSPGYADCDQNILLNGCEVWTDGTPQHCGACNTQCPIGWSCVNGVCVPP